MLFTSYVFLYVFLPAFLVTYYALPSKGRAWWLAVASYVFYGWWRPDFVILMWISTCVDFFCGRRIRNSQDAGRTGKPFVVLSVLVNLGLLAYFKYANFGIESLNAILAEFDRDPILWVDVVLPVGISFYTFQTLSYSVDVYRRQADPVDSFGDFACYVAMFPQLVAGPIVRYRSIAEQLREPGTSWAAFSTGCLVFFAGLTKKVLLADTFAIGADAAFGAEALSTLDAWLGALCYTFQIYFDFSGYSDMALGLGLMMGFRLPVNFDRPYVSRSVTEFWRRWHISLSSFLRDYLYIPLGGNRHGTVRTYVNLALTMLLGGLWHGAAWTFIAWGAYQGFWLILERLSGRRSFYASLPPALEKAVTFVIVIFGWVLFRSESIESAGLYMQTMFGLGGSDASPVLTEWSRLQSFILGVALVVVHGFRTTQSYAERPPAWWIASVFALTAMALVQLHRANTVPFLYFQF
ncbi:MAG: MBOAT family protein [Planctomycetota bacterium]